MQLIEYILQPTAKLKTPLQILFLKRSERKESSKISKILKVFAKWIYHTNFVGLQPRISDLSKKDPKKNVSLQCSEIVGILPQKGLFFFYESQDRSGR